MKAESASQTIIPFWCPTMRLRKYGKIVCDLCDIGKNYYIFVTARDRGVNDIFAMRFPPSGQGMRRYSQLYSGGGEGESGTYVLQFRLTRSCAAVGTNCPPRLEGMR